MPESEGIYKDFMRPVWFLSQLESYFENCHGWEERCLEKCAEVNIIKRNYLQEWAGMRVHQAASFDMLLC